MTEIDPREFGRLQAEGHSLRAQVASLQQDVRIAATALPLREYRQYQCALSRLN